MQINKLKYIKFHYFEIFSLSLSFIFFFFFFFLFSFFSFFLPFFHLFFPLFFPFFPHFSLKFCVRQDFVPTNWAITWWPWWPLPYVGAHCTYRSRLFSLSMLLWPYMNDMWCIYNIMKRKNKEKDYLGKTTPSPLLQQIVKLRATDRQITSVQMTIMRERIKILYFCFRFLSWIIHHKVKMYKTKRIFDLDFSTLLKQNLSRQAAVWLTYYY